MIEAWYYTFSACTNRFTVGMGRKLEEPVVMTTEFKKITFPIPFLSLTSIASNLFLMSSSASSTASQVT
eukprot:g72454.t1